MSLPPPKEMSDTEILDWMITHQYSVWMDLDGWIAEANGYSVENKDLRQAVCQAAAILENEK